MDLARERAKNIKWRTIESLDQYLESFEANFTAKGGKVLWAETAEEALQHVMQICNAKAVQNDCEEQEHGDGRNSPQ